MMYNTSTREGVLPVITMTVKERGTENAGLENAGLENAGPNLQGGKGRTGKHGNIICIGSKT